MYIPDVASLQYPIPFLKNIIGKLLAIAYPFLQFSTFISYGLSYKQH